MFKQIVRNFALALTLAALSISTIHAQAPAPAVPAVTGGDPEPTSPTVAQTILIFLHLA
jgi:hypothetical protein